ncbi:hypothetical protein DPMN_137389 [Dreissena polymorpha]|uniref:Uncharacterized protein n=1 Tax=Dreissena polymorpha TaxID=45954 RepID=A0A9D4G2H5_DREPO|nr:hypothetical protein DPMN_137389 [Dreissena polymorpha]
MLKVAFQRKLLFTINCDGEIVYNEIKLPISSLRWAKSDFERVTAQLEAKGITLADIDSNDNLMGTVIVA